MRTELCLALAILLIVPSVSRAAVVNGSFEAGSPQPADGSFSNLGVGSTAITGWTVVQSDVDWGNDNGFASDGSHALDLNGHDGPGGIRQTLLTTAGAGYTVQFDMNANNTAPSAVSLVVSAAGSAQAYIYDPAVVPDRHWVTMTFQFTALAGLTTLEFDSTTTDPVFGPGLDNVRVVPAPGMAPFFLALTAAVAATRRRIIRKRA